MLSGVPQGTMGVWTSIAHNMKEMWTAAPIMSDPSRKLMLNHLFIIPSGSEMASTWPMLPKF